MIDLYCYSCESSASKLLDSDIIKIVCTECDSGTMHKCIRPPMFKQASSHGSVNTAGNIEFNKAGKQLAPPRSNPDEPDIERK